MCNHGSRRDLIAFLVASGLALLGWRPGPAQAAPLPPAEPDGASFIADPPAADVRKGVPLTAATEEGEVQQGVFVWTVAAGPAAGQDEPREYVVPVLTTSTR